MTRLTDHEEETLERLQELADNPCRSHFKAREFIDARPVVKRSTTVEALHDYGVLEPATNQSPTTWKVDTDRIDDLLGGDAP